MRTTNVKCSVEELAEIQQLSKQAAATPVMATSVAAGLAGRDFASLARKRCLERCHELALAHGLPEIPGYYGVTPDGEFVRT